MATVEKLAQIGFSPNQAKHLGINGIDLLDGGWITFTYVDSASPFNVVTPTLIYASATSVTVPGDITSYVQLGTRVKFTQTTVKYFVISSVSYAAGTTTINFVASSDYSVANAAITDPYFSQEDAPYGFPCTFSYAPTLTGFSADPTNTIYRWRISPDGWVSVDVGQSTPGTSNATGFTISAPIAAKTLSGGQWGCVPWFAFDNGAALTGAAQASITSASSTITLARTLAGVAASWTNANGKAANLHLEYPAR